MHYSFYNFDNSHCFSVNRKYLDHYQFPSFLWGLHKLCSIFDFHSMEFIRYFKPFLTISFEFSLSWALLFTIFAVPGLPAVLTPIFSHSFQSFSWIAFMRLIAEFLLNDLFVLFMFLLFWFSWCCGTWHILFFFAYYFIFLFIILFRHKNYIKNMNMSKIIELNETIPLFCNFRDLNEIKSLL